MATADISKIPEAELEALTAPGKADGSATVSQEELDRRYAAGLGSPFDPDDDDLDEDMQEPEAKKPDDKGDKKKDAEAEADGDEEKGDEPDADEGDKDEEKAEGEPEKEPEVDPVLAALQERAKAYKIDVTKFPNAEALEAGIIAVQEILAAKGEEILEAEEAAGDKSDKAPEAEENDDEAVEVEAEADPDEKKKPTPKKFDDKGKKIEFKLDKLSREEYAPELLDAMAELKDHVLELRTERDKLRGEMANDRAARDKQRAEEQAKRDEAAALESQRRIDAYFAKKAKESPVWTELFGTAPAVELVKTDEGKKLFKNRQLAYRKGEALVTGLQSSKLPTEDFDTSLDTGVRIAFGKQHAEAAAKKVTEKVKERRESGIPRPNSSRSAGPRGSALRAAMKKHGMSPDGGE